MKVPEPLLPPRRVLPGGGPNGWPVNQVEDSALGSTPCLHPSAPKVVLLSLGWALGGDPGPQLFPLTRLSCRLSDAGSPFSPLGPWAPCRTE